MDSISGSLKKFTINCLKTEVLYDKDFCQWGLSIEYNKEQISLMGIDIDNFFDVISSFCYSYLMYGNRSVFSHLDGIDINLELVDVSETESSKICLRFFEGNSIIHEVENIDFMMMSREIGEFDIWRKDCLGIVIEDQNGFVEKKIRFKLS